MIKLHMCQERLLSCSPPSVNRHGEGQSLLPKPSNLGIYLCAASASPAGLLRFADLYGTEHKLAVASYSAL